MKRQVLIYGLVGGLLITALKWSEYRYLVLEHSFAIYGGLTAAIFVALGICLGRKLSTRHRIVYQQVIQEVIQEVHIPATPVPAFTPNDQKREELDITPREFEVLSLIADGMSNREIAAKLFVSENTIKTHSSRVFDKLGARRRTQAVQLAKSYGLLP